MQRFWIWATENSEPKDQLVLCSDGLYSLVSDQELGQIVSRESPQRACMSLVELARERGGYDNITVAIIPLTGQLKDEPPPHATENSNKKLRKKEKAKIKSAPAPRNFGRILAFIFLLTLLSFLVTVSLVLLVVGK